jgi:hypothetical protein
MWPAALTYVIASDREREIRNRDRHTGHVVRKRRHGRR